MTALSSAAMDLEGTLADLVDLLVKRLAGTDRDRVLVAGIVEELALNNGSARKLIGYIEDHRDALMSGRSDGPASRLRLLDRLADVFPGRVERARCVRCGRSGLLNHRLDGQRGCSVWYA